VLEQHDAGSTVTRSELEERFLRFCDERGIPRPRVNEMIAGLEVDFSWPRLRLASSSTAGRSTARVRPSNATAGATRCSPPPASACCDSRTTS
jgi:hypothetical protein